MDNTILPHPALDFFRSNHRPYYIVTAEWTQQSAGTRATFHLCHVLNEMGYEAYVVAQKPVPHLRTPILTTDIMKHHKEQGRKAIGIYTELMWGNTLGTDVVVKWMMNRENMYSNSQYDNEALYYYFSRGYTKNETNKILKIPLVDPTIFNHHGVDNDKRSGFAYFAYKYLKEGKGRIHEKFTKSGISLCKDIPRTHREIANILRSIKAIYLYEDTSLIGEAALCGCPPIIVKTAFLGALEKNYDADIVVDEGEIDVDAEVIPSTPLIERYEREYKDVKSQLFDFVNETQNTSMAYTGKDPLLMYLENCSKVFIYGVGIVGSMVFNALKVKGIFIDGFIVSDNQYDNKNESYYKVPIYPLSWLKDIYNDKCGVVLAMTTGNCEQVTPQLKKMKIKYFA